MAKITVSADQVRAIASDIEKSNNELMEELAASKALIEKLASDWTGEAYESTKASFNAFATKYFDNYKKVIEEYIKFLRLNVSEAYSEVETQNINLGDAFK